MKYKDAGVNIDEGNKFVEMIKPIAKTTMIDGVLNGIGGFGALYEIKNYKKSSPRIWYRWCWNKT